MILRTIEEVEIQLKSSENEMKTVGFVPTMGALHFGHGSLVQRAKGECDLVVVSVFVNPTQFNNTEDLKLYPRQEDKDIELLVQLGCDFVFIPEINEIYPKNHQKVKLNLNTLAESMEGKHRPGHFDGVVDVVSRLFQIISPSKAYFGRKDFQQVAVIKEMTRRLKYPIEIVVGETIREPNGLAMSSRNMRLSEEDRKEASIIYEALCQAKTWAKIYTPAQTVEKMEEILSKNALKLEYIEIVDPKSLEKLSDKWIQGATACIAVFLGNVRLIDNMELVSE